MDYPTLLETTHEFALRANTTSSHDAHDARPPIYKVVGICLAVASGLFIGVSFVLKKVGLLKANVKYNEEAGEGYGYLKNAYWWSGMTLMILGEVCNFVAYAFVDAILVTPLGALSVVVTTILSAIFLKERLSFVGKVGCFNCIVGSVVIVINAPEQSAVATIQDMKKLVVTPGFLTYMSIILVGCACVALFVAPRYGKKSMLVYLSICSLIGGLSVVCTQGLGAAIVSQIGGTPQFNQWFLYVVLVFVIATLLTEIIYLNKALNLFNAALVTPTYYVFFTSATIVTSAVLFQGFKGTPATIATVIMGFLQICTGVILLQLSKSAKDVPDTAVFKGDLDQVRTVAEQEEPEYEPKADTIRGGAAIIRSISKYRTKKQVEEAKRLHEETMQPIGEGEVVEWDGLRRRKTVLEPGSSPVPQRARTQHYPLGMSHFPDDDDAQSVETDFHPGIFPWRRRSRGASNATHNERLQMDPLKSDTPSLRKVSTKSESEQSHTFGLPFGLRKQTDGANDEDTSYHGASQHIHFADESGAAHLRSANSSRTLTAPTPPPHGAKRQFSFQNIIRSNRQSSGGSTSRKTEEERVGLVQGDSRTILGGKVNRTPSPPAYSDAEEEWATQEGQRQSMDRGPLAAGGLGVVHETRQGMGSDPSLARGTPLPHLQRSDEGGGSREDRDSDDFDDGTPTPTRQLWKGKF